MKTSTKFLLLAIMMFILMATSFIIVGGALSCTFDWITITIIIGYTLLGTFFSVLLALSVCDYANNKEQEKLEGE